MDHDFAIWPVRDYSSLKSVQKRNPNFGKSPDGEKAFCACQDLFDMLDKAPGACLEGQAVFVSRGITGVPMWLVGL